ncbi:MAG: hypothetical protein JNL54_11535 [Kineosporiaceae bacterium]|nr:hypothetical protein [Kineosporiaceae bacterium]
MELARLWRRDLLGSHVLLRNEDVVSPSGVSVPGRGIPGAAQFLHLFPAGMATRDERQRDAVDTIIEFRTSFSVAGTYTDRQTTALNTQCRLSIRDSRSGFVMRQRRFVSIPPQQIERVHYPGHSDWSSSALRAWTWPTAEVERYLARLVEYHRRGYRAPRRTPGPKSIRILVNAITVIAVIVGLAIALLVFFVVIHLLEESTRS